MHWGLTPLRPATSYALHPMHWGLTPLRPFLIGERLVDLVFVERLELRLEVGLKRLLVGNGDRCELLPAQLCYELLLKLRFALICHTRYPFPAS